MKMRRSDLRDWLIIGAALVAAFAFAATFAVRAANAKECGFRASIVLILQSKGLRPVAVATDFQGREITFLARKDRSTWTGLIGEPRNPAAICGAIGGVEWKTPQASAVTPTPLTLTPDTGESIDLKLFLEPDGGWRMEREDLPGMIVSEGAGWETLNPVWDYFNPFGFLEGLPTNGKGVP